MSSAQYARDADRAIRMLRADAHVRLAEPINHMVAD